MKSSRILLSDLRIMAIYWIFFIIFFKEKVNASTEYPEYSVIPESSLTIENLTVLSSYIPIEKIQQQNIEILEETIPLGWDAFCNADVDEGVMSLFSGISPSDAAIYVMTLTNQSVELPIKLISEIRDYDINPERKTLLYVNGYYTPNGYFSVMDHLKMLQSTRRDLNVIIVNFARDVQQLYYAVKYHLTVQGYFIAKILETLVFNGIEPRDITLAGHSVGANIAALGARIFATQTRTTTTSSTSLSAAAAAAKALPEPPKGIRLGQFIAIDPARMCQSSDIYVQPNVSDRVVVIHGESESFGLRKALGTIDIYPNGIGAMIRKKEQPGCESPLCSHMYPFILFMEALIEGVNIPAVNCESWLHFRKMACDYSNIAVIGLEYSEKASGSYFCTTQANPPFTFMENGIRYKKTV